ncbi:MAG: single-stranded DNA-binding protein [Bacillota bacterium]
MLNVVVLIGRLTADPEARYTVNGVAVTNFRLAVDRPFTNREGERETDFFDVVCWRKLAETVANNLRKGRLVAVQGRMQLDRWQQDGQNRSKVVVVADQVRFLDWPSDREGRKGGGDRRSQGGQSAKDSEDLLEDFLEENDPPPFN